MADSTERRARRKATRPAEPCPEFPLFPHQTSRWAKKIRGKIHFFGRRGRKQGDRIIPVEDAEASAAAAKGELDRRWPYISQGRTAPPVDTSVDTCTIRSLCNAFWRSKRAKLLADELSQRSFQQYEQTTDMLVGYFGKDRRVDDLGPDDFERLRSSLAERNGPVGLKDTINLIRMVFKFAADNGLIDRPVLFGQSFDRPSAKALRRARNAAGPRMFEASELRRIIDAADTVMRAMILLGLNCGFGNSDVATLPRRAVNMDNGWINYPRPKTEIERRVPLWSATAEAIRVALAVRRTPAGNEYRDLCFFDPHRTAVGEDAAGPNTAGRSGRGHSAAARGDRRADAEFC